MSTFRSPLRRLAWSLSLVLLVLTASACDTLRTDGDGEDAAAEVTVMSYNLYLGADLFALVGTTPEELPRVTAELFADVQAANFPARAEAIAALINEADPALIGLQEAMLYRTQTPSDFVTGTTTPNADNVAFDYLKLLLDALADRGLAYEAVAVTINADAEAPAATDGQTFTDIRITDRDVILARESLAISNVVDENFSRNVTAPVPIGDRTIDFLRGYNSVVATINGVDFTFANTHLEVEITGSPVQPQEGQALELLDALDGAERPVILAGDFNSPADGSGTRTYTLLNAAYTDAFAGVDAPTCCQAADLRNPTSMLDERIDLILYRGDAEVLSTEVLGEETADQTEAGLWPSDHAGVAATLRLSE